VVHVDPLQDTSEAARKRVLDLLEKNPQAAPGDQKAEEEVCTQLGDASDAAKRIVVIGGTGAGKSAFCGLLDGSLTRDPNIEDETAWSSNYKLGHGVNAETDVPELRVGVGLEPMQSFQLSLWTRLAWATVGADKKMRSTCAP
jgi:ATPase subunit of ABC transporter with duplicated ATPase domains